MALLVLVEDDALQMIRIEIGVGIGLPVFLVQVGDLNGPSLYIDPLGEQIQTLVAAVEIEVDELLAGGILEPEALRGLEGIVLPGLGGVPEIGDQGIFCAAIHFQKRVVPVQLEVVGALVQRPGAVAAALDGAGPRRVRRPVRQADPVLGTLGGLMMFVLVDGLHGPALRVDVHGGHIFGIQEDHCPVVGLLPVAVQQGKGVGRALCEKRKLVARVKSARQETA